MRYIGRAVLLVGLLLLRKSYGWLLERMGSSKYYKSLGGRVERQAW